MPTTEESKQKKPSLVSSETTKLKIRVVNSHSRLARMIADLSEQKVFALNTKTDRLDARTAMLEAISISTKEHNYIIPFKYIDDCLLRSDVFHYLQPLLLEKEVYSWDAKFDLHVLLNYGIQVLNYLDVMGMVHTYSTLQDNSLDARATAILGYGKASKFREVKRRLEETGNPTEFFLHAALNSQAIYLLGEHYRQELQCLSRWEVFLHQENKVIKQFLLMERRGIDIDVKYLREIDTVLETKEAQLGRRLYQLVGEPINLHSPKQLVKLLFETFDLPVIRFTDGDTPSTDSATLKKLAKHKPDNELQVKGVCFCKEFLKYRKIHTERSLYTSRTSTKGLVSKLKDAKLYGSFHPFGTKTGRASSSNPNLQNIKRNPKRDMDDDGNLLNRYLGNRVPSKVYMRDAFIAHKGEVLISVDYSQIELRLIAHFSRDPIMLGVYHNNGDIHETTRSGCRLSDDEIGRTEAKAVNFGIHYGRGAHGLAEELGWSFDRAEKFINDYWQLYAGVKSWQEVYIKECMAVGEVRTLTNRRRLLHHTRSTAQDRIILSTLPQGSAADIIKNAMIILGTNEDLIKMRCQMLLQIHDELIFRVPEENAEECCPIIQKIMEMPIVPLSVPLVAIPKIGKSWGEIH
jgi:DNA polymerase-1